MCGVEDHQDFESSYKIMSHAALGESVLLKNKGLSGLVSAYKTEIIPKTIHPATALKAKCQKRVRNFG